MADVFQEVDEALQKERMEMLWKRYRVLVIGGIVALVVIVGVVVGYRNWDVSVKSDQTDKLFLALESEDVIAQLEGIQGDLRPGHRAISMFLMAAKHVSDDKIEDAQLLYQQIFEDLTLPQDFRNFALLMQVRARMGEEDIDADRLLTDLSPLSSDETSVWYEHALVQKAILLAHGKGDLVEAIATLKMVRDSRDVAESLKQRAVSLIHVYELKSQK